MDTAPTQPQTPNHIETTSNVRGRVCSRAGYGKLLIGNDGRPIYDRNFCNQECRRADKRERMQEKRRKARSGRCPHCGRKFDRDCSTDGRVPRHNAPPVVESQLIRGDGQDERFASANRL